MDDFNETEDFLELINLGPSPIDLAGYFFGDQDGGTTIQSGSPEITTISSGGVLVLWYDNDPDQGPLHIEAKLNNDGENIIGIDPEGNTIIDIVYGAQSEDVSYIALPDGATMTRDGALVCALVQENLTKTAPYWRVVQVLMRRIITLTLQLKTGRAYLERLMDS